MIEIITDDPFSNSPSIKFMYGDSTSARRKYDGPSITFQMQEKEEGRDRGNAYSFLKIKEGRSWEFLYYHEPRMLFIRFDHYGRKEK
jgi:hypothetical protein